MRAGPLRPSMEAICPSIWISPARSPRSAAITHACQAARAPNRSLKVSGLQDCHCAIIGNIDQSISFINAAQPRASQGTPQQFRLANTLKWVTAQHSLNQRMDAPERFAILGLPVEIVFTAGSRPDQQSFTQGSLGPRADTGPPRTASSEASRRSAFLGERRR